MSSILKTLHQINELVYYSVYGFEFNFHYIADYLSHHAKRKTMSKLNFSIPKFYTRGLEIDNWDDLGKEQQQLFLQKNWYTYYSFRCQNSRLLKKVNSH